MLTMTVLRTIAAGSKPALSIRWATSVNSSGNGATSFAVDRRDS
jgi:hypothetical protein